MKALNLILITSFRKESLAGNRALAGDIAADV